MEQVINNVTFLEEVKKKKELNGKVEKFFHITQETTRGRDCFIRVIVNKDITSEDIKNYDMSDLLDEMGVEWEGEETYGKYEDLVEVEPDFVKDRGEWGVTSTYDCSLIEVPDVKKTLRYQQSITEKIL